MNSDVLGVIMRAQSFWYCERYVVSSQASQFSHSLYNFPVIDSFVVPHSHNDPAMLS